ncbi:unnamed protein product [Prunus armeniaca]
MVGSKRTRSKTAAMTKSVTTQCHSTHDPAIDMVAPPPLTTVPPTRPAVGSSNLRGTATEHDGTSHQGGLVTTTDLGPVLEQLQAFPPLPPRSTHAPAYRSNETLAHVQLGSTHFSSPNPRSQADLNMIVDQLAQRMDDQTNLMRQLLHQINLVQNLDLGQPGEERMMDERTYRQLDGYQAGRAGMGRQGEGQQRDQLAGMSQASASHTQSNVRERLGPRLDVCACLGPKALRYSLAEKYSRKARPQGGQLGNPHNEDREERHSTNRSRRTNSHRQVTENPSQARSTNTPPRQRNLEDQPLQTNEEVTRSCPNRKGHQRDRLAMCAEDVEKLVNNRLQDLKIGGNFEDALRVEVDRANSSPFTVEIEQAAPPKRFSTPFFTCFKGDSDPESHLKHFKSLMILYKAEDVLMCKVFAMTLQRAAQDWFHTLLFGSISSFKELAYVFTKEYTSYRSIKKNPDHLFNLHKKSNESLRDYIKRFKAERANIVGCDDQIAFSAFKRGLPTECELYRELTIYPRQTLVEVFAIAERYALWDDNRIATKKADQVAEQASQENGKRRSQSQEGVSAAESYTKFTIPIHQILAQVKDMPWLKKPSLLKGNPTKKDTNRYCTFHEGHGHYTNDCFAWKRHLEDLVRDGHCTEFIARRAIQQIKDCDAANDEPPRKRSYGSTRS